MPFQCWQEIQVTQSLMHMRRQQQEAQGRRQDRCAGRGRSVKTAQPRLHRRRQQSAAPGQKPSAKRGAPRRNASCRCLNCPSLNCCRRRHSRPSCYRWWRRRPANQRRICRCRSGAGQQICRRPSLVRGECGGGCGGGWRGGWRKECCCRIRGEAGLFRFFRFFFFAIVLAPS